jgi:hypothetical protein
LVLLCLFKSKRNGFHRVNYKDGGVYEGNWVEDERHGHGVCTWPDGDVYEGEWPSFCLYTYLCGDVYNNHYLDGINHGQLSSKGDWKHNENHGEGKLSCADNRVYEGGWKDGVRDGYGAFSYRDGALYKGEWREDRRHGQGKYTWANGDVYEGEWPSFCLYTYLCAVVLFIIIRIITW